jgi:hypothetical protein
MVTDTGDQATAQLISIENYNLQDPPTRLNSPRTLNAIKLCGLTLTDLQPINELQIIAQLRQREQGRPIPTAVAQVRIDAANKLRM